MVFRKRKKVCSDCKAVFEVDWDEFEEGDAVSCPECNLEYTVVSDKRGSLKLIESKDFEMDEDEDFGSVEDEDEDFGYYDDD